MALSLDWKGGLRFSNSDGSPAMELHSSTPGVASPPQALAYAVMACMAMDIVEVLQKGRHVLESMTVTFEGHRAPHPPRRYTAMHVHFNLVSNAESQVIERAIRLSREKYCSVWHTVRQDVEFVTTHVVTRPSA